MKKYEHYRFLHAEAGGTQHEKIADSIKSLLIKYAVKLKERHEEQKIFVEDLMKKLK